MMIELIEDSKRKEKTENVKKLKNEKNQKKIDINNKNDNLKIKDFFQPKN